MRKKFFFLYYQEKNECNHILHFVQNFIAETLLWKYESKFFHSLCNNKYGKVKICCWLKLYSEKWKRGKKKNQNWKFAVECSLWIFIALERHIKALKRNFYEENLARWNKNRNKSFQLFSFIVQKLQLFVVKKKLMSELLITIRNYFSLQLNSLFLSFVHSNAITILSIIAVEKYRKSSFN